MSMQILSRRAVRAGRGRRHARSSITLKASGPGIGITEVFLKPGDEPPMHVHRSEDEWLYVLDGEVAFHVERQNHRQPSGGFVSFPRGIPHTLTVETPSARFLVMNTPGGFERMFELVPGTPHQAEQPLLAFGMEVVGPQPRHAVAAA